MTSELVNNEALIVGDVRAPAPNFSKTLLSKDEARKT